jgi:heme/copper-type cytochrome/quinol oxidase subunit 2
VRVVGADGRIFYRGLVDGKQGDNTAYNANSTQNMDYYVKTMLINMWLILGLILVVNLIVFWCYCRHNRQKMRMGRVKSNNTLIDDRDIASRCEV